MTARISVTEYRSLVGRKPANKFNAVRAYRCALCNSPHVIGFDSKAEARRYDALLEQQKRGLISELRRQIPYEIRMADKSMTTYVADFVYRREGSIVVEDVKSRATLTPLSKLKIKLAEAQHGITVEIVR